MELEKIYQYPGSILLTGQPGTGKSTLAQKIHLNSRFKNERFVTIDLAAVNENLLESELFGHEQGSFTGANSFKIGQIEHAGSGTVFMDEIGELSLSAQKKLLRLIETKTYKRVGANKNKIFNGRFIFATNKNLKKMSEEGSFREDLYYRLLSFNFELKPLSSSPHQRRLATKAILEQFNNQFKKSAVLSDELQGFFDNYSWPGNFRELKNCLEYLVFMSDDRLLSMKQLPDWLNPAVQDLGETKGLSYKEKVLRYDKSLILDVLNKNKGQVNKTALALGLPKSTLKAKLNRYNIDFMSIRRNASSELASLPA